jgi:hypothetical protein
LYYEQGIIQHVLIVNNHLLRTPGHFQSLLQINLRWYMLIAGISSFSPLEFPTVKLPHLDGAWLNSTQPFLAQIRSHIFVPSLPTPELFRQQDQVLMDAIITLSYTMGQVQQVNWCRRMILSMQRGSAKSQCSRSGTMIHPSTSDWS